jgi:hypothetical protein
MKRKRRWAIVVAGMLVLLFGLGCLNYTRADGLEHHRQQAARYNLPPPTPTIFLMGVVSTIAGAGLIGFGLGCPRT